MTIHIRLFSKDSPQGKAARISIPLERPEESLPDKIDAFITRDWPQVGSCAGYLSTVHLSRQLKQTWLPQVIPGRKALYQAGFLVARHNPELLQELIEIVREGNYKEGYGLHNGWGSGGYGGFVGGEFAVATSLIALVSSSAYSLHFLCRPFNK